MTSTANGPLQIAHSDEIAELARSIGAMGSGIDSEEAKRAADIAFKYSHKLAIDYGVTDSALIHNIKVNLGERPRGLCWHWADDLEARLRQENFRTLELHRAIANSRNVFRIEHSTVIISARGASMNDGTVLDPWRFSGKLYWSPTLDDDKYVWVARKQVFAEKSRILLARQQSVPAN